MLGVKVGVKKRPYDMAARLMIDEICVVDRMHHYGPEYELLVCSSGGHLVFPEPDSKPEETVSLSFTENFEERDIFNVQEACLVDVLFLYPLSLLPRPSFGHSA